MSGPAYWLRGSAGVSLRVQRRTARASKRASNFAL